LHGVSVVGIDGTVVSFNLPNKLSKVISERNLETSRVSRCSIFGWVYRQNIEYLKMDECSFSGKCFGHSQMTTVSGIR
jgi:hypothetical protein